MLVSARLHYASLALLELAMRCDDASPVSASEITQRYGIPGPFLVQILRTLRAAGWVQSIRGSQGGYRLSIDPAKITLLDIAEVVGCQDAGYRSGGDMTPAERLLQQQWDDATEASRHVLSQCRLIDLVEQCRHGDASMFYI